MGREKTNKQTNQPNKQINQTQTQPSTPLTLNQALNHHSTNSLRLLLFFSSPPLLHVLKSLQSHQPSSLSFLPSPPAPPLPLSIDLRLTEPAEFWRVSGHSTCHQVRFQITITFTSLLQHPINTHVHFLFRQITWLDSQQLSQTRVRSPTCTHLLHHTWGSGGAMLVAWMAEQFKSVYWGRPG